MCTNWTTDRYINFYTDFAFKKLLVTEIAKLNPQERYEYEDSLKNYRDWFSVIQTAELRGEKKGEVKGMAEGLMIGETKGKEEVARNMKYIDMSVQKIAELTGLTPSEIEKL